MKSRIGLFYNKKAFEKLLSFVIYLIIVAIILIGLLMFINNYASAESVKEQVLAKQIALAIDAAKPGTQITITKINFIVSISNNEVNAKSKPERMGYSYKFFTTNKIETKQTEGIITIIVS